MDCQKTFTRRTTLTRHQNHHTGTVEESAKATAEALARGTLARTKERSESEQVSNQATPMTTPSPAQRPLSLSPSTGLANMEMQYLQNNTLPAHLRGDVHVPNAPTTSPGYSNGLTRPTSHPTGYVPPATMEPTVETQQGPGSATGSPQIGSAGWASPGGVGSPAQSPSGNGYVYPDPEPFPGAGTAQMFYDSAVSTGRRLGSGEPQNPSYHT